MSAQTTSTSDDDTFDVWTPERARSVGLVEMGRRPPIKQYFVLLWSRREFALLVPLGELRQRNMDTVLGGLWHLLNPLFQAGIYYLLFGVLLQQRSGVENYPAWLIVGLFTFGFTQKTVQSAARVVVSKAQMLRSLNFPAVILPISTNISELLAFIPALVVMMLAVLVTGEGVGLAWLFLPIALSMQLMFNLGLSLIVARLTVDFRDLDNLLSHLLRIWLYFSGVLFPIGLAPEGWIRTLLQLNPSHVFIELSRGILLERSLDTVATGAALAWSVSVLLVGGLFFYQREGRYSNAA